MLFKFIGMLFLAYFLGSIANGIIVGKKLKGIDIREHGSKNTGATNAWRVLGRNIGILVLILDALKGFLPVYISMLLKLPEHYVVTVGIVAILGHTFSMFLKFKGGKGVATSMGVFIALAPKTVLITFTVFVIIVSITKYISLGSIVVAIIFPLITFLVDKKSPLVVGFTALIGLFVIYKHKTNIKRLIKGEENKFTAK